MGLGTIHEIRTESYQKIDRYKVHGTGYRVQGTGYRV
jgi:hypothetical protein